MASQSFIKIFIALVTLMNAFNSSLGAGASPAIVDYLKHFCSLSGYETECWAIVNSQLSKFKSADPKAVAAVLIDLSKTRTDEFLKLLDQLQRDSKDKVLKAKYSSCSANYNNIISFLIKAKTRLESKDYLRFGYAIDDVFETAENCRYEFLGFTPDPAHFGDRVKEYNVYVFMLRTAIGQVQHPGVDNNQ